MIWVAVFGIMAILGSVFMLKPSRRDARLATLRFEAARQGLQLKQYTWEPDSKKTGVYDKIMATSYTFLRPAATKQGELLFSIVGQKGWGGEGLPEGYSWHKEGFTKDAELFSNLLPQLQDDLLVLEVWENKAMLMAKENETASAQAYQHFLESFLKK